MENGHGTKTELISIYICLMISNRKPSALLSSVPNPLPCLASTTLQATYHDLFFDSRRKERYKMFHSASAVAVHAVQLLQTKAR